MTNAFKTLHWRLWALLTQDDGQGLTEYALILTLIAIVSIVALNFFGGKVTSALSTIARSV